MFRNFINLAVNQNRIKPSKFINILYFFIVSEKLSKLSIPSNNTKLTMFYTFHKNWQCVKSALHCFCFWSLYFLSGKLVVHSELRKVKESNQKYHFEILKNYWYLWACTWFTIHDECIGLKLIILLLNLNFSSGSFLKLIIPNWIEVNTMKSSFMFIWRNQC